MDKSGFPSVNNIVVFRFCSCPDIFDFIKSSVNIIDFIATLSFYIDLLLAHQASHLENADVLEFFSIIRILRLFKLTRHSSGLSGPLEMMNNEQPQQSVPSISQPVGNNRDGKDCVGWVISIPPLVSH